MTMTTESSTPDTDPRFPDTSVYVSLLVSAGTTARVIDDHGARDIVAVRVDGCGQATHVTFQGALADVAALVDDIAHQLMRASTRRAAAEEDSDARARGLAGVAELRDAARDARATA